MFGTLRGSLLKMLLAFFAGAISMLIFLTPGDFKIGDLMDPDKRAEIVDFNQAAVRIEQANDDTLYYAYQVREYVNERVKN